MTSQSRPPASETAPRDLSWWGLALILAALLAGSISMVRGGDSAAPAPPLLPEGHLAATLQQGDRRLFAVGVLTRRDLLVCESNGLTVGALVPKAGSSARQDGISANSARTASIVARTSRSGAVRAACS